TPFLYCLLTSTSGTVLSCFSPWIRTVTFPAFASTLTTVASALEPFLLIFTLSPALSSELAGLASCAGVAAGASVAGVAAGLEAFAFELFSFSADSQAETANANVKVSNRISLLVIVILRFDYSPGPETVDPGEELSFRA